MDAEIVLDQNDGLGVREVDVGQVFQDASVIHGGMRQQWRCYRASPTRRRRSIRIDARIPFVEVDEFLSAVAQASQPKSPKAAKKPEAGQ